MDIDSARHAITLQCVGCKKKRLLDERDEKETAVLGQPFCRTCGLPMVLIAVAMKGTSKQRAARKKD